MTLARGGTWLISPVRVERGFLPFSEAEHASLPRYPGGMF